MKKTVLFLATTLLSGSLVAPAAPAQTTGASSPCQASLLPTLTACFPLLSSAESSQPLWPWEANASLAGASDGNVTSPCPGSQVDTDTDTDATGSALSAEAQQVVAQVNTERARAGLPALTVNPQASAAAQVRARELRQSFSHTRPNGASCFTALAEAEARYQSAGENIAYGQPNAAAVMDAWMNSEGHRANILNESFTQIGVGCYRAPNGTLYWVQFFLR